MGSLFKRGGGGGNEMKEDLEFSMSDFNAIFRSRRNVDSVVNEQKIPRVIVNLRLVANVLMVILIVISFVDFFLSEQQYQVKKETIVMVDKCNMRNSEFQSVLSGVQNLRMVGLGVFNQTQEEKESYENEQRQLIEESVRQLDVLNKEILLSSLKVSVQIEELNGADAIQMHFGRNVIEYFDM